MFQTDTVVRDSRYTSSYRISKTGTYALQVQMVTQRGLNATYFLDSELESPAFSTLDSQVCPRDDCRAQAFDLRINAQLVAYCGESVACFSDVSVTVVIHFAGRLQLGR